MYFEPSFKRVEARERSTVLTNEEEHIALVCLPCIFTEEGTVMIRMNGKEELDQPMSFIVNWKTVFAYKSG